MTELKEYDGRPAVMVTKHFSQSPEILWSAISTAAGLSSWFPSVVDISGRQLRFRDFAVTPAELGEILERREPTRLVLSWHTDLMILELEPGTTLRLTYVFDDLPGAASYATGWETCLEVLAHHLRQEPVPEFGPRPERHQELALQFGLDEPQVAHDESGWMVRWERQMTVPAEVVWDHFRPPAAGQTYHAPQAPEAVLGVVTESSPAEVLDFVTGAGEPGDRVRLELTAGTGHGIRAILTVWGHEPTELAPAVAQWGVLGPIASAR
ncbi:hypothetical protein [Corynebacterium sp. A21]|uniref:hypothetical protein n=1 Tax=Corynebacterium sp. A21 TaxID=3457318 RepID=UPI003FD4B029